MGESSEGPLATAALRLDRALAALEAALKGVLMCGPTDAADEETPGRIVELQQVNATLSAELAAARQRSRKLTVAASEASKSIGRAAAEVRRTLDEDAGVQGLFVFALESEEGSGEEPYRNGSSEPEEETTA